MNIIDERDTRTIHRKIRKKEYDNIMTLAITESGQRVRLLDEGAVVMADGSIDFYIKKGVIRKYYDSLDDTYEGSINLGHMPFAQFPILLGKWKKKDLQIVDIGDGREALDVYLRLDDENSLVQDLHRADYDIAVSAEFTYKPDEEASQKWGFLVVDEIFITDFAIVGEPGNVNSAGIKLKGGPKVTLNELSELIENEKQKHLDVSEGTVTLFPEGISEEEADKLEEEVTEVASETVSEEVSEEAEEVTEEAEEVSEEAPEEAEEASDEVPQEEVEDGLRKMASAIEELVAQNKALSDKVEELSQKLSAKEAEEKAFCDKFKNLYVSIAPKERKAPVNNAPVYTDGIGE